MQVFTLVAIFACFIVFIQAKGLREEFTWTRISYVWPNSRNTRQTNRQSKYGGSYLTKPSSKPQEGFLFPDGDSEEKTRPLKPGNPNPNLRPSGTGGNHQLGGDVSSSQLEDRYYGGSRPSGNNFGTSGGSRPGGSNFGTSGGSRPSGSNFGTSGGSRPSGSNLGNSGGGYSQGYNPNPTSGFENDQSSGNSGTSSGNSGNSGDNSTYIYRNNIPMGANVWRNKLFITVPRRRAGVPSSLNYVPLDSHNKHNVPLIPYPNWEINTLPDSQASSGSSNQVKIVSVYRVAIDSCDRLWFVDTGLIEIPGSPNQVMPTKIVVIDLLTDQVIRTYNLPEDHIRPATTLASLTIDADKNNCNNAYAYIPDLGGYGLIVYSLHENRSWRITHNYFYLEPLAGEFKIAGHTFQWNDGIFSTALSPILSDGYRDLYFHSMAGTHLYCVSTEILRNETAATRSYHGSDFKVLGDRGPLSQTSASDLHQPSAILFLGLVNQNALGCWNTQNHIKDISIVQKDDQKMIYPCDVKVRDDNVILLTNTMPAFLYGQLNYDQVNFRVWIENVYKAVEGTKCEPSLIGKGSSSSGSKDYKPRPYGSY